MSRGLSKRGRFRRDVYHNLGALGLSQPHLQQEPRKMGVENFIDAPVSGKRKDKRARVLLAVKIRLDGNDVDGRLRDLSRKGALVECGTIPPVGSEVLFTRGTTSVPARVAWTGGNRIGLEFAYMIDGNEVLVQLGRPTADSGQAAATADIRGPRFRRPRLFGEDMSEQDRKIARDWGLSVGIALPGE
jgi:hypothetical protein